MSHLARAREVFDVEIAALKAVRASLDEAFDRAVELVVDTVQRRGKVVVVGIGKSGNIGRKNCRHAHQHRVHQRRPE